MFNSSRTSREKYRLDLRQSTDYTNYKTIKQSSRYNRDSAQPEPFEILKRHREKRKKYRLIPVIILGDIIFFLIISLSILAWSIPAFFTKQIIGSTMALPLIIYLSAIFISSYLVSCLIKAKSFVPIFMLVLTYLLIPFIIIKPLDISIPGILLKTFYSFLTAFIAFTIVKITYKKRSLK